ncbi:MAG: sulfurtransferase complex subunit TusD [Candidatus Dasytiphilus stammeri]
MTFVLIVTGPPYGTQQASSAFLFIKALIKTNHTLHCVFFYNEGIYNANCLVLPATDEFDLITAWEKLSKEYGVPLHFCTAAALRRGVIDKITARQKLSKKNFFSNVKSSFKMSGLGTLVKAILKCDRLIQF